MRKAYYSGRITLVLTDKGYANVIWYITKRTGLPETWLSFKSLSEQDQDAAFNCICAASDDGYFVDCSGINDTWSR